MSVDSDNPKHTDGETRLTNISEGFARQRLEMQYVASLAKGLAQANQDKFSVYVVVNEHLLNIRATTDFDVTFDDEIKPLSLSVGITKWKNGTTTQEVNIRPEHGSWMDDDAVSYRLDVSVGTETEREFERIAEKPGDNVKDVLLGLFDTDQEGQHVSYMDRFAESTMRA